jgi:hypothetical protein
MLNVIYTQDEGGNVTVPFTEDTQDAITSMLNSPKLNAKIIMPKWMKAIVEFEGEFVDDPFQVASDMLKSDPECELIMFWDASLESLVGVDTRFIICTVPFEISSQVRAPLFSPHDFEFEERELYNGVIVTQWDPIFKLIELEI